MEWLENNFLMLLVRKYSRGSTPLDLLFPNREGLVGDMVIGSCLDHSDHEITKFFILGDVRTIKNTTLDFQREDFELFRKLVRRIPWESVLKDLVQEG